MTEVGSRKRRTEKTEMPVSEKAKRKRKVTGMDDEGAENEEKTDGGRKRRPVTVRDPEETDWVTGMTEFMGRMEKWEKRREARESRQGGSGSMDDGDGGPDGESDGEAGGVDEGGVDIVEGGWRSRAGRRRRRQKSGRGR